MEKKNTGLGIAGFVLSVVGIIFCFIPYINVISYIMGFLALIFGIISLTSKKSKNGLPIASIVLAIIAFLIASTMNSATTEALKETSENLDKIAGNSTEEVLKKDVEVTLGDLEISTDEYGLIDSKMVVTVKNISNSKKSYSIHIEAVDNEGQRIDEDYVMVNDLGPGQITTEKIFEYIEKEKLEAMQSATFKIIEASAY